MGCYAVSFNIHLHQLKSSIVLQVQHHRLTTKCRTVHPLAPITRMACPRGVHQGKTGQRASPLASIRCPRRASYPLRPQEGCPTTWVAGLDRLACHLTSGYPPQDPCLVIHKINGQVSSFFTCPVRNSPKESALRPCVLSPLALSVWFLPRHQQAWMHEHNIWSHLVLHV